MHECQTAGIRTMPRHDELNQAIQAALANAQPANIEEAQAVIDRLQAEWNDTPLDDFDGLSPRQMSAFLYHPFDAPELATFARMPPAGASAPILLLYGALVNAIGERGLKATTKGNLPRKLVQEAALAYYPPEAEIERRVYREEEFPTLHGVRRMAEMAGLIRKQKGLFHLTRAAQKQLSAHGVAGAYAILFRTLVQKFNWGVWDLYDHLLLVQHAFLFSMRLLARHGDTPRPESFYADAFLRAFPMTVDQVTPTSWETREEHVRRCYVLRTFRALRLLGFAEREEGDRARSFGNGDARWHKQPLLDAWITFRV